MQLMAFYVFLCLSRAESNIKIFAINPKNQNLTLHQLTAWWAANGDLAWPGTGGPLSFFKVFRVGAVAALRLFTETTAANAAVKFRFPLAPAR